LTSNYARGRAWVRGSVLDPLRGGRATGVCLTHLILGRSYATAAVVASRRVRLVVESWSKLGISSHMAPSSKRLAFFWFLPPTA
jgi:hypothetical protein